MFTIILCHEIREFNNFLGGIDHPHHLRDSPEQLIVDARPQVGRQWRHVRQQCVGKHSNVC